MILSPLIEQSLSSEIDPAYGERARFILTSIANSKPKKILDAGCGRGYYLKSLTHFGFIKEIHGIDSSSKYLSRVKQITSTDNRVKPIQGTIYDLPYPDNYFDAVICSEVLEHLKKDDKAMVELRRVLKKGGKLLISVPNYNFPFFWDPINWILMKFFKTHINKNTWWLAGIWADHERLYTKKQILSLVKKSFVINKVKLIHHLCWPFSHFLLYGIGKNIVERLNVSSFDRFNTNKSSFPVVLARIFIIPSSLKRIFPIKNTSVNIAVECYKQ